MKTPILTAAALALLATPALAEIKSATAELEPMILINDVVVEGNTVTFPVVDARHDGYVVIHAVKDGMPVTPGSLGHAAIDAGRNENVMVTIAMPFVRGESYVAMLHEETNDNDTYDFGEANTDVDTPVMNDDRPITSAFEVQ
jgi:hypothetical protein